MDARYVHNVLECEWRFLLTERGSVSKNRHSPLCNTRNQFMQALLPTQLYALLVSKFIFLCFEDFKTRNLSPNLVNRYIWRGETIPVS
ncbi:hypothetical protein BHAP_1866 [Bifidobacterium hapali]|uniref:Uncharacterized protein n=1 Tax=Bifidobacterium hapali TaxID=1630172 RepID=A0A261FVX7_9BIFI|nr:hypothetical protein BHAP_1866 [Bifidobacterium hapali]